MRTIIRSLVLLCALAGAAHAQTQVLCNQGSSKVPCTTPLLQTYVPASIPATKIGGGAVDTQQAGREGQRRGGEHGRVPIHEDKRTRSGELDGRTG